MNILLGNILASIALLIAGHACAADANGCISVSDKVRAREIRNNCDEAVIVYWCHDFNGADSFYRAGLCDSSRHYYRKNRIFGPGEAWENPYDTPAGSHITFGACFGSYSSIELLDDHGSFMCGPHRKAGDAKSASKGGKSFSTATAADRSEEVACRQAQDLLGKSASAGECSCQHRGGISICKAEAETAPYRPDFVQKIKQNLRERAGRCDPVVDSCKWQHYVATGVRG